MKKWRLRGFIFWKSALLWTVLVTLVLVACQQAPDPSQEQQPTEPARATQPADVEEPTQAPDEAEEPTQVPDEAEEPELIEGDGPRQGGTLVFTIEADPPTLNMATTNDSNTAAVASKIYNGLVHNDPAFLPVPNSSLAQSWEVSEDGLTYTISLREGVQWHDGEEFTCEDVQFTYTEVLPELHPVGEDTFGSMESFECTDDYTAVITLSDPFPPFMSSLRVDGAAVLPKHLYEGTDILDNPHNMEPVGTGPFMLEEWVRGDHITLVRNPNYFQEGRPFLDRIIFRIIPEPEGAVAAFEAGEIDFIPDYRTLKSEVGRLDEQEGVVVGTDLEPPKPILIFFNLENCELCQDIEVRRAIAHAINREQIIDLTKFGLAVPAYTAVPPAYEWAYNPDASAPEYDPDRANQILDEAGYERGSDGMRFTLELTFQAGYVRVDRPNEVLRQQLREVGIDLQLNPLERNTMITEVHHEYNFELYDHLYSTYGDPALGISRAYRCSSIDPTSQFVNVTRYCNERIDELFDIAASGTDLEERAEAYYEIQEILTEDLPVIPLVLPSDTYVGREEFVGLFSAAFPGDSSWDWVWWTGGEPMEEGSYEPIVFE